MATRTATSTVIKFDDGRNIRLPLTDDRHSKVVGILRDGRLVVQEGPKWFTLLSACCRAYDKGSYDGVVCRACYNDFDSLTTDTLAQMVRFMGPVSKRVTAAPAATVKKSPRFVVTTKYTQRTFSATDLAAAKRKVMKTVPPKRGWTATWKPFTVDGKKGWFLHLYNSKGRDMKSEGYGFSLFAKESK